MAFPGLALAVISGIAWAGFDAVRKAMADRVRPVALASALALAQAPVFAIWNGLAGGWALEVAYWPPALLGLALNIAANVLFMASLRLSPLGATVPMLSFTPALSALVGALALGEALAVRQIVGIGVVVGGALLLNARAGEATRPHRLLAALLREPGTPVMGAVALCWSGTAAMDKMALDHAATPLHALMQAGGVGLLLLLWLLARGRSGELRAIGRCRAPFVGGVGFAGVALGFQLLSLNFLYIGVMEAVKRSLGLSMAVLNGWIFFREEVSAWRIVAVVLMATGVGLVVWP